MTAPRAKVAASLAERGRPEMWATESDAATLSGMSTQDFAWKLPYLERAGFPKRSAWNNKRFIPHIEDFWRRNPVCDLPKREATGQDNAPPKEIGLHGRGNKYTRLGKFAG